MAQAPGFGKITFMQFDLIQKTAEELLGLMGLDASVKVKEDKKDKQSLSANGLILVDVEAEDAGIFIGRHGETIQAFQLILNQIVYSELREAGNQEDAWKQIIVNCGDYRQRQEEGLRNLAFSAAARAKETGKPQSLYDLTAAQRRVVHLALSDDLEVTTESEGEGRERRLVVKLKV